jgi:hypothetical protein
MTELSDRVMSRVEVQENGCWVFTGTTVRGGYGQIRYHGKTYYVHRVIHEALIGPIPDGFQVDHLCFNPPCCNPAHLEAVTRDENMARSRAGARGANVAASNAAKTHCPRNHPYDEENTYVNAEGFRWCRACRRERYSEGIPA